ncbi:hypothetical protein ACOQFV_27320 [Nocardiopsis changdeensis]|uniref:Head-tail adaptor protein n=1 Tax=Nocardiopsis changdeensis TaxID=2831969 RepID=A0ABX8BNZ4_9ACTN|nr:MULTISPECIES: hypothetical protein [Nocardiopsis]QUX22979.1 hypothetical protein KGD84_00780 [Nocardiopsis changdeensis]QYX38922.1 hypothetical protein K1J57_10230 [Nocardiopsis sp. MT53]
MPGTIPGALLRRMGWDITVEPYTGAGAHGPVYGPPVTVRALMEAGRRKVTRTEGDEVVSTTTLRVRLADADHFPAGSRVGLPDGTTPTVITTVRYDGRKLPVPSHLEVSLT